MTSKSGDVTSKNMASKYLGKSVDSIPFWPSATLKGQLVDNYAPRNIFNEVEDSDALITKHDASNGLINVRNYWESGTIVDTIIT